MFPESDQAGIRVVVRNQAGQGMAALSKRIQKPNSAEIFEALATRRAVQFTLELGFKQSVFEGDSEVIIKALDNEVFSSPSVGHIVKDIWSMSGLLQIKSFSYVRRQGNSVVHALTQRARFSFPVLVWMENVPLDILRFVSSDFPSF
ncbi:uncharacterized protein LOC115991308 [Quercus lobata]|uniref:uncharacterized protein LOC115991308 n=1 Tax=Quercus lobata TaxID=97700 RepID=UPI001243D0BF|nr:uncharacterized protein LOC115991308 [Quercus lobata]